MNKYLLGTIFISISIAFVWGFCVPEVNKIIATNSAIAKQEAVLADRKVVIEKTKALYGEMSNIQSQLDSFRLVIPDKKSIAEIVTAIDGIGALSGVDILEISANEDVRASSENRVIVVSISARGTEDGIMSLLENIEKNIRIIDIYNTELGVEQGNSAVINAKISGRAYMVREEVKEVSTVKNNSDI